MDETNLSLTTLFFIDILELEKNNFVIKKLIEENQLRRITL